MNTHKRAARLITLGTLGLLIATVGCQSPSRSAGPIRAIWVTRFDYKTPHDVQRVMENCANAGFNTVLWQVRGNGTVSYESHIEPWAEQFDFRNPGFDPLKLAISQAHTRGLELHAWVNVMPAWRGPGTPRIGNQLYNTRPEWFWYDAKGRRQPIRHEVAGKARDWYVSLNPCLPEVRAYLVDVFRELVSGYDVDGLHMDYIRFPNEPVVAGERIPDYPRDRRTLTLFKKATGQTPESAPAAWNDWRTAQVTKLVADIRAMMRRTKPRAALSAAVGSVPKRALTHFQDGTAWVSQGIVDAIYLMNYTPKVDQFTKRLKPWLELGERNRIVPGLMLSDDSDAACKQIEASRSATGNYCIFAYSSLFDSVNTELDRQDSEARRQRKARREKLIPFIRKTTGK